MLIKVGDFKEVKVDKFSSKKDYNKVNSVNVYRKFANTTEYPREQPYFHPFPLFNINTFQNKEAFGETKAFKRDFNNINFMIDELNYRHSKKFSPNEIKKYFKKNYGIKVSENPTDREGQKMLGLLLKEIKKESDLTISLLDSRNSKLEISLKRIDELQKNWK